MEKIILIPVPTALLQGVASVVGKKAFAQRLCESLQVDISKTQTLLNWTPLIKPDEALLKTAIYYKHG